METDSKSWKFISEIEKDLSDLYAKGRCEGGLTCMDIGFLISKISSFMTSHINNEVKRSMPIRDATTRVYIAAIKHLDEKIDYLVYRLIDCKTSEASHDLERFLSLREKLINYADDKYNLGNE